MKEYKQYVLLSIQIVDMACIIYIVQMFWNFQNIFCGSSTSTFNIQLHEVDFNSSLALVCVVVIFIHSRIQYNHCIETLSGNAACSHSSAYIEVES